jgi:NADPH:quinone reductase-like Zn-dependent oxidoreductase
LLKSCDVCGVFWGAFTMRDPKRHQEHVATLFQLWQDGKIAPRVTETYPLERGGDAIAKLASRGAIGKLVVEIG